MTLTLAELWGRNIRQLLTVTGRSEGDLAGGVGVTREAVMLWLAGKRMPRPAMQIKIAQFFNADPSTLFPLVEVKAS